MFDIAGKTTNPDIRDAILCREELEEHARDLAVHHAISMKRKSYRRLLPRMEDNYEYIIDTYKILNRDVADRKQVAPAAEWLFDNFYVVEERVKYIRLTFPKSYYRTLPSLVEGSLKGFPRVYGIALELVSHTDGRIEEKLLTGFIEAYQSKSQLTSGELWAVPIMLNLALIENIRNICEGILKYRDEQYKADRVADAILSREDDECGPIIDDIRSYTNDMEFLTPAFAERLLRRVKMHGTDMGVVLDCIGEKLASQDKTAEDMIGIAHQEQAKNQISIGNSITSLRLISTLDWSEIFERLSPVEKILRQDPAGLYGLMDFESRDYYRHNIEEIATSVKISESLVARKSLECAKESEGDEDVRKRHVGYYIAGGGRGKLESLVGYKSGARRKIILFMKSRPTPVYLWSIAFLTIIITGVMAGYAWRAGGHSIDAFFLAVLGVIIPASDIGIGIVNFMITHMLPPSFLPKLELKHGIPEEFASMVVVPTLLPNAERVEELFKELEIYYLANQNTNLFFAILGDFVDGKSKVMPSDEAIVKKALEEVKKLNDKYSDGTDIFYFFHRYRKFNPGEGVWMGWERKRGKLIEFNELLRGFDDTSYYIKSGDISKLPRIKYIITLDADTELPMGAAKKLIGTISHPLNSAVYDKEGKRVVDGYGILQPRISICILNANKSSFSRIYAGQGGIDPYTTAVSDVYQDLFGEGIYTGKGIYDVDVFQKMLDGYIPENAVLSHDLLEGSYTRAGLVTDIEFVDGFPSRYNSYSARMHRWVRGDWQLLPWLFPKVKNSSGEYEVNPLSIISKWKIFDNLRRSLIPPALTILIFLSFTVMPGGSLPWLSFVLLTSAFPVVVDMADAVISRSRARESGTKPASDIKNVIYQIVLMIAFLPYRSYLMVNAIALTLVRICITKRNLLEWETAADAEARLKNDKKGFFTRMWTSPAAAALLLGVVLAFSPYYMPVSLVFIILWISAPSVAYWISKVREDEYPLLDRGHEAELRSISRKTWRYFEEFASLKDNYLPPDNYQEEPPKGIAHRTSPTNIGLLLASTLCARDMGYISTFQMIERLENTFSTLEKLEKWRGHFYNWYDTVTLQPLKPLYVSSVDSGNLAAYLMLLKEGLREYMDRPMIEPSLQYGLIDTIGLIGGEGVEDLREVLKKPSSSPKLWYDTLLNLKAKINRILREDIVWAKKLDDAVLSFLSEVEKFYSWIPFIEDAPDKLKEDGFRDISIRVDELIDRLNHNASPVELSDDYSYALMELNDLVSSAGGMDKVLNTWLVELKSSVMKSYNSINELIRSCRAMEEKCVNLVNNTDFEILFDEKRELFSIGYSVEDGQRSMSYYDLLASEARVTSFLAVAKGMVDQKHWFRLGRPLASSGKAIGLVSWSGTMFEYLMPLLIMKNYKDTLMDMTYGFALRCQIEYGNMRHVPWGVSESGYNRFDMGLNYQYRAFGVPKLGFKRGLVNDIVVAPYASILALMVDPAASVKNLRSLKDEGLEGGYGFYEAVDYTPGRVPVGRKKAIVKSYMVHHHGMSLMALDNVLNGNIMQERFHRDPAVKSAQLLLQEKVPGRVLMTKDIEDEVTPLERVEKSSEEYSKVIKELELPFPECHILSNGRYSTVLTNSGSGFSKFHKVSVTRWTGDVLSERSGMFFYIQNINSNDMWSSAYEPCRVKPEKYKAVFSQDKVEYLRTDGNIDTHTEIVVSPEDDVEIRRISLTNHSGHSRIVEVTSYFEVVISPISVYLAHPAFNKLFVKTEFLPEYDSLAASRRPRTPDEKRLWLFHTLCVDGETVGGLQYETDRAKFIGRNRDVSDPEALDVDHPLSNTCGAVIDPIMSLRRRVRIKPGETVRLSYATGVSDSRDDVIKLARKYHDPDAASRAFELAWTRGGVEQGYLNLKNSEVEAYRSMISHILYNSPLRKGREDLIVKNTRGQSGLWPLGISGDLPIVLVAVSKADETDIVHEVLKAHEYWRVKGLEVDLCILNEDAGSYLQSLQGLLNDIIGASHARDIQNRPGGVFIRQAGMMKDEERTLLYSSARIVLKGSMGPIAGQLKYMQDEIKLPEYKYYEKKEEEYPPYKEQTLDLLFYNGLGGFKKDGREYVIRLDGNKRTPAPWSNIISNSSFGCIVTESGGGYTWAENSREFKITPWSNDPVADPPGDVVYIRDDEDGKIWTITPSPVRQNEPYTIRHGFGYTVFQHVSRGIKQEMTVFVPEDDSVKIMRIRLKNISGRNRKLSAFYYLRPVLGVSEHVTSPFIVTEVDGDTGVLLIRNTYSDDFPGRVVFVDSSIVKRSMTADREEFIGRGRDLSMPLAMRLKELSGRVGAGFDPCGALEVDMELGEGEEREAVFTLGEGKSAQEALSCALKYRDGSEVESAYNDVKQHWCTKLGTIQVSTPDTSLNILVNGWLMYQTISSRLYARSAFYQSGGAYGFRDQLQDVMAVCYICPDTARKQILYSSSHQFLEGDVQHWWHLEDDRGIRTKFSDDLLWLPYVVSDYINVTNDISIMDHKVPFLEDEPLNEDEDERYNKPRVSNISESIYEHCIRAIDRALKFGEHGIPLMGSGDWNDGMSSVGNRGRGESVWLGWFMYLVLKRFEPMIRSRDDDERADRYLKIAEKIVSDMEKNAWDGSWYRRAYFDDGTPLGSASNTECKIDSLGQSWAVISGAGKRSRAEEAMMALEKHLIRRDDGLILLLAPPFDDGDLEPGYIKGYVPGVRENGGQYTHAAVWVILAYALMGNGGKAWELYNMINPINHSSTPMEVSRYKVEPYVMAADVYAVDPHRGRGGWTWYTGASGWMYRVGVEHILGLKLRGGEMIIDPCIPEAWDEYSIRYMYKNTPYIITVKNPYGLSSGVKKIYLDGELLDGKSVHLVDDNNEHHVDVLM